MPLFTKHRDQIFAADGTVIRADDLEVESVVPGFSNPRGKPNRQPLEFLVTRDEHGNKRFTLQGLLG